MSEKDAELDDATLFETATSDEPVTAQQEAKETEQVAESEPTRDEAGRFAAKTAETEKSKADEQQDEPGQVPSWRVREINDEKRALAEKVASLEAERSQWRQQQQQPRADAVAQPKIEKPDPLLDPEGYEKYLEKKFEEKLLTERRETSLQLAARTYKDEFNEAYTAAQKSVDPALRARMQQSRDPGETLIQWYREQKVRQEVGLDPSAWLEKKLEERMKDPAFLSKVLEQSRGTAQTTTQSGRPIVKLPPSLNGASRANAQLQAGNDDLPDDELFHQITG